MKAKTFLLLFITVCVSLLACKSHNSQKQKGAETSAESAGTGVLSREQPADGATVFENLRATGEPFMLTGQPLTGEKAILDAFYGKDDDYFSENTPAEESFFFPERDIRRTPLVRAVMARYNLACAANKFIQAIEVFQRMPNEWDEEKTLTRKDTLMWVKATQPALSEHFLSRALEGAGEGARRSVRRLLSAYKAFDGDEGPLQEAFGHVVEEFNALPEFVSQEDIDTFRDTFWVWYDKARYVPEIDRMVRTHLKDGPKVELDSLQLDRFREVVMGEKDIHRRAILALEYVQVDRRGGALLLGDIIESGIYTPYLLEVWISWRANVQMEHSPSSFSVIANNYFDRMRVKCFNTFLRHYQESGDGKDLCLIQNLIYCEPVHRQASFAGNESVLTCMHLAYEDFIHPRMFALNEYVE